MKEIVAKRNSDSIMNGKKLLVGYLLAGYPEKESFLKLIVKCEAEGIDIFEIGFPSEDPSSDGEVIQKAHQAVDSSICGDVSYWTAIRNSITKPIWIMGYRRDLIDTGFYKVLAQKGLVDAFVIPDMNFHEHQKLADELFSWNVDVIGFVNPDMQDSEIDECLSNTALVYQQLYTGPTGMAVVSENYVEILNRARKYNHVRVFAGFGISTPQRVMHLLSNGFDGVIVGTAMIRKLNDSEEDLLSFIRELKASAEKAGDVNAVHSNL